eukprot:13312-Heterococcus_DN1.PRE.1
MHLAAAAATAVTAAVAVGTMKTMGVARFRAAALAAEISSAGVCALLSSYFRCHLSPFNAIHAASGLAVDVTQAASSSGDNSEQSEGFAALMGRFAVYSDSVPCTTGAGYSGKLYLTPTLTSAVHTRCLQQHTSLSVVRHHGAL